MSVLRHRRPAAKPGALLVVPKSAEQHYAECRDMGCLKGKSEHKPKPGRFACRKCGAVSKKKGHLCKPKKIREPKAEKTATDTGADA